MKPLKCSKNFIHWIHIATIFTEIILKLENGIIWHSHIISISTQQHLINFYKIRSRKSCIKSIFEIRFKVPRKLHKKLDLSCIPHHNKSDFFRLQRDQIFDQFFPMQNSEFIILERLDLKIWISWNLRCCHTFCATKE